MVYSVIPARSGSKGVPNKNIKLLNNRPLMFYSIDSSLSCPEIERTIVTTDSFEYKELVEQEYKDKVSTLIRPEFLSNDFAGDIDYLLHLIYVLALQPEDLIVLLRPTTPLRKTEQLSKAINKFKNSTYDSLRSMHQLSESPEKMFKLSVHDDCLAEPYMDDINSEQANQPRQNFNRCYQPNGYVDIIWVEHVLKTKTVYGNEIMHFITNKVIEVDSPEDFYMLELIMKGY